MAFPPLPQVQSFCSLAASMRSMLPSGGILFEKTRASRWGKSRPWFLWLCLPFALFGVLTFVTPNLGSTAKILDAAITYVVASVLYTGINTPVTSILAALTPESHERVVLTRLSDVLIQGGRPLRKLDRASLVSFLDTATIARDLCSCFRSTRSER